MKPVDVLGWWHRIEHGNRADMIGKWQLHQDAISRPPFITADRGHEIDQLSSGD
jgi:hypothetical protein